LRHIPIGISFYRIYFIGGNLPSLTRDWKVGGRDCDNWSVRICDKWNTGDWEKIKRFLSDLSELQRRQRITREGRGGGIATNSPVSRQRLKIPEDA
jgi:hypothetical protein